MNIKQIKQDKADTEAALLKVKAELGVMFDKPAKDRTDAEASALTAKKAELTKLEALAAQIADDYAVALRAADVERSQASKVTPGKDNAEDKPWAPRADASAPKHIKDELRHMALGNFAMAVRAAAYGDVDVRLHAAATGAGTQTDSNLGFAVPNEVAPGIEREMFETGEILGRVDARSITGNNITYNMLDETSRADSSRGGGILGYWVDEGTAPTASNTKLAKMEMKLRKVGAFGVMTDELLSDAVALGGELEQGFALELIFQVENKVWRGNGSSAPLGFLNAPCLVTITKETNQTAATINTTNLVKMWARMPSRSKKNAVWYYNTECGPQLHEMSQAIGTGGTAPRFVSYAPDGSMTIFGRPAIDVEYAEAVGTVGDIACVDLKKYRLIRKGGVEQASSMHVYFAQGEQAFRAFYRVDGQPVPRAALTPFKGSAQLSPFVVLGTRS
jgi:HK97 family phage major capsid protein